MSGEWRVESWEWGVGSGRADRSVSTQYSVLSTWYSVLSTLDSRVPRSMNHGRSAVW